MADKTYPLHFNLKNAGHFGWPGLDGYSYSERTHFERVSAARFKVSTSHGPVKSTVSDRVYLVLDGDGWFDVEGTRFDVKKDDVVIVPRNSRYDYGGQIELFLVHSPGFDRLGEISFTP